MRSGEELGEQMMCTWVGQSGDVESGGWREMAVKALGRQKHGCSEGQRSTALFTQRLQNTAYSKKVPK